MPPLLRPLSIALVKSRSATAMRSSTTLVPLVLQTSDDNDDEEEEEEEKEEFNTSGVAEAVAVAVAVAASASAGMLERATKRPYARRADAARNASGRCAMAA